MDPWWKKKPQVSYRLARAFNTAFPRDNGSMSSWQVPSRARKHTTAPVNTCPGLLPDAPAPELIGGLQRKWTEWRSRPGVTFPAVFAGARTSNDKGSALQSLEASLHINPADWGCHSIHLHSPLFTLPGWQVVNWRHEAECDGCNSSLAGSVSDMRWRGQRGRESGESVWDCGESTPSITFHCWTRSTPGTSLRSLSQISEVKVNVSVTKWTTGGMACLHPAP